MCTACTVDSRQRSILQYVDRLNIGRRNVVDVVSGETIDDEERLTGTRQVHGTTHADIDVGTRGTIDRRYLHTGDLTLEGLSSRCYRHHSQFLTGYRTYRTGQVLTNDVHVAEHDNLVSRHGVLLENHLDRRTGHCRNLLGYEADKRDL